MIQQQEWYDAHPELHQQIEQLNQQLKDELSFYLQHGAAKRGEQYLIPVVFHILHTNGPENISDEQVEDAVRVLNEDFNLQNPDTADIVAQFKAIAGNPEISFRLAQRDPSGNPSNGITRTFTELSNDADESSKIISWPRDKYLNIWVVNSIASGAAGYTFYPSSAQFFPSRDGIIILHNYVGSIGTGSARRSRALTHEVGHWIDLPHVWGSTNNPGLESNCFSDDGVSDTPLTIGWRSCNLNGETCGDLDNVQNYMDYSYCYTMFTKGQSDRMRVALTSNVAQRNSLISPETHRATGVKEYLNARWEPSKTIICEGEEVSFVDKSKYDQNDWNWSFEGGSPQSSTLNQPQIRYNEEGEFSVELSVGDGQRQSNASVQDQILVLPKEGMFTPYTEDFESPEFADQLWKRRNADPTGANGWVYSFEAAYGGKFSLKNSNYSSDPGRVDDFISTTMDWSSFKSAIVSFRLAFRQRGQSNNDRLRLYISSDCGATWQLRWVKTGSELATGQPTNAYFIPRFSDWVEHEITTFPLGDMAENIILRFSFESGGGNELYIDNISIAGVYKNVPVLNFPLNEATNIDANVSIDWKPIFGVSGYEYQIDTDTSFSSTNLQSNYLNYISVDPHNEDTEQKLSLQNGETYFWRVRSYFNTTPSAWSSVWSFTVSSNGIGDTLSHRSIPEKVIDPSLSVQAITNPLDVKIWPNPSAQGSSLNLEFNETIHAEIEVMNPLGQHIYRAKMRGNRHTIETTQFPPGVLWLKVKSEGLELNRSIIIK